MNEAALAELNVAVLSELGRSVHSAGGELVVIDATGFFVNAAGAHAEPERLCEEEGFGYVPAYRALREAKGNGHPLRWAHDGHFDDEGNEILAQELWRWMSEHAVAHKD